METLQQPYQQQQYFNSSSSGSLPGVSSSWSGYPSLGSYSCSCPTCSSTLSKGYQSSSLGQQQQFPSSSSSCAYCCYPVSLQSTQFQQPQTQFFQSKQEKSVSKENVKEEDNSYQSELQKTRERSEWKKRAFRKQKGGILRGRSTGTEKKTGLTGVSSTLLTAGAAGLIGNSIWNRATGIATTDTRVAARPKGAVPHFAKLRPMTWQDASFDDYWTWQTYVDSNRYGREKWAHEKF